MNDIVSTPLKLRILSKVIVDIFLIFNETVLVSSQSEHFYIPIVKSCSISAYISGESRVMCIHRWKSGLKHSS